MIMDFGTVVDWGMAATTCPPGQRWEGPPPCPPDRACVGVPGRCVPWEGIAQTLVYANSAAECQPGWSFISAGRSSRCVPPTISRPIGIPIPVAPVPAMQEESETNWLLWGAVAVAAYYIGRGDRS